MPTSVEFLMVANILFTGSTTSPQIKVNLRPSNPQMIPATRQIQYSYSLNMSSQVIMHFDQ